MSELVSHQLGFYFLIFGSLSLTSMRKKMSLILAFGWKLKIRGFVCEAMCTRFMSATYARLYSKHFIESSLSKVVVR